MENEPINLQIFLTPFRNESRVLKETQSLVERGFYKRITVVALQEEGLAEHESLDEYRSVWRVPLKTRHFSKSLLMQIVKYFEWFWKILARFSKMPVETIHCHSLSTLPIAVMYQWLRGGKVIYDAHELETELHGMRGPRKWLSKIAEHVFIGGADSVLVVSDSIGRWYSEHNPGLRTVTVRNVPVFKDIPSANNKLRHLHQIPESSSLFLYQGALSRGRGIENMLDVFSQADCEKHIVFMGYGELETDIRDFARRHPNIHLQSAVPPHEIMNYTAGADVGFVLTENSCLSHYYSLPNKLFEYLLCGVPVIGNDLPEIAKVLETFDGGWILHSQEELHKLIRRLSREEIRKKKANTFAAAETCRWQREEAKLLSVYASLLSHRSPRPS